MNSMQKVGIRSLAKLMPTIAREVRAARKTWRPDFRLLSVDLLDFGTESRVALRYYAPPTPPPEGSPAAVRPEDYPTPQGEVRFYVLGTFPRALSIANPRSGRAGRSAFSNAPRQYRFRSLLGIYNGPALVAGYNVAAQGGPLGKGERLPHFIICPFDMRLPHGTEIFRRPLDVKVRAL